MLDRLFGFKIQDYLQTFGLFIVAVGLPLSKVLMSIGTIWLAANVLLKYDYHKNWKRLKSNSVFWFVFIVLLLHLIGLTYTDDYSYALKDLNAKLPFFAIPIALIAYPIQKNYFKFILYGFLCSLLITSIINYSYLLAHSSLDYREFSRFGSHIRYGILVVMGIVIGIYLFLRPTKIKWLFVPLVLWFTFYTMKSSVTNSYFAMLGLIIAILIYGIVCIENRKLQRISFGILFLLIIVGIGSIYYQYTTLTSYSDLNNLPEKSRYGETYYHDRESGWINNGEYVMILIADNELKQEWAQRSEVDWNEELDNGIKLKNVLISYMTSKHLTKDKEGVQQLSNEDVKNIESGILTVIETYPPYKKKYAKFRDELLNYKLEFDPDGRSVHQRFEHWIAAKNIIVKNWFLGVGTGDVQDAFNKEYEASSTLLDEHHWYRAHNQYLTFWITFGLIGFLTFTGFWFFYLLKCIQKKNFIGISFCIIAMISFLSEDTIETQQGVTFIAFFLGLLASHLLIEENYNLRN